MFKRRYHNHYRHSCDGTCLYWLIVVVYSPGWVFSARKLCSKDGLVCIETMKRHNACFMHSMKIYLVVFWCWKYKLNLKTYLFQLEKMKPEDLDCLYHLKNKWKLWLCERNIKYQRIIIINVIVCNVDFE